VFKAVKRSRSTSPKLPSAPSPKKFKPIPESDAQLAARLSLELNGPPSTRGGRATRGDVSGANAKKVKAWGKAKAKKEPVYDADGNEVIKPVSTTGFNKPWALSEALADIVGVPVLSRPQVTKQLWVYIKKEGWAPFMFETFMSLLTREIRLQNPGNGNEIFPDEKLSKVFPVKMITSFKMAQHLKWVAVYLSVMLNDADTSPTDLISTPSIPKRRMISSIRPLVLSPPQSVISRTHHHRPTRR
jgi:upstream activation factor subunit UAF30